MRRESQQRRVREKSHNRGLSASYLEGDQGDGDYDDDDEGAISLSAIKKDYKRRGPFGKCTGSDLKSGNIPG